MDKYTLQSWQVAYSTRGPKNEPQVTITTVILPSHSKKDKIVSYQPKTDSAAPNCRTSYGLNGDAADSGVMGK